MKVIALLIVILIAPSFNSKTTPREWFDTQYTDALYQCKSNKVLFTQVFSKSGISPRMVLSIAFPEMLRYTLWKDLFETKALEILYVSKGSVGADFSIGWFQMKPSFAEKIEQNVKRDTIAIRLFASIPQYDKTNTVIEERRQRIERLKQMKWQAEYLSAFTWLMKKEFDNSDISENEMLKYFAAAYNRGMNSNKKELSDFLKTKTFPYGQGHSNPFCYAEIVEYFYENDAKHIF